MIRQCGQAIAATPGYRVKTVPTEVASDKRGIPDVTTLIPVNFLANCIYVAAHCADYDAL